VAWLHKQPITKGINDMTQENDNTTGGGPVAIATTAMLDEKLYWGKFVNGKMTWTDIRMTRDEMLEFDDTYRHNCK